MSDGVEKREDVMAFYGQAAINPKKELCCPISYVQEEIAHIPSEALDISYGCGSPVDLAAVKPNEVVVDLGSGGGIDCFIAAKKVGPDGKVIGVDMTDNMIDKAKTSSKKVSDKLGYDVVEFRKGYLEEIPIENDEADVVISNCVINLSYDKEKVFEEIYRILKDRGRFCISDVVSEKDVPQMMQKDKELWGECISGALSEEAILKVVKKAGFYGMEILNSYLYEEVEGMRFYSITLTGYKFKKASKSFYKGEFAIYKGPFKSVLDDDGYEYPVGIPVEICTDTVTKLQSVPYSGFFTIIEADETLLNTEKKEGNCAPKCC